MTLDKDGNPVASRLAAASVLTPRSVAVVGAGAGPGGVGNRVLQNLIAFGFRGMLFPVNAKYEHVLELPCYPSLDAIGQEVDVAVIAVPAQDVVDVVAAGARAGIKNYVVMSSGFGEAGVAGKALEQAITELASRHDLQIMGPNCLGSVNFHDRVNLTFSAMFDGETSVPGPVAFVGQSGGLATIFYSLAARQGIGFSFLVSSGNEAVLDLTHYIEYLLEDSNTKIIVAYAEQIRAGRRLIDLGHRAAAMGKHIVILKSARATAGARAAISHTGSIAGNDAVCAALFRRAGIVKVRTMEEALAVCKHLLAPRPLPTGRNVALLAISGGTAVLAADIAEENGLSVPPLSACTKERLREWLPEFASFDNPLDVTAGLFFQPEKFAKVLECISQDPGVDSIVMLGAYRHEIAQQLASGSAAVLAECPKFSAVVWIASGPEVEHYFIAKSVPFFHDIAQCFEGLSKLVAPGSNDRGLPHGGAPAPDQEDAMHRVVTEDEVKRLLRDGGIPVPPEVVATTAEQARLAARQMGYPLAMKVISPDVPHRAKVGGIALGATSEDEVCDRFGELTANVQARVPGARLDGILIQKMVPPGPELLLGMSRDPSFGPVLTFGMGGILTEALGQATFAAIPVTAADAERMIADVPVAKVLLSFDQDAHAAIVDLIVRVSDWCMSQGDALCELDLNPVILCEGKPVLVDALAVIRDIAAGPTAAPAILEATS